MPIELMAPAKNAEQGILALRCGADAVYVGGPRFGARKGAANEMADLERLAREARLWRAKMYVALNTILFEDELEPARRAAWAAYEAGADALIVQDMAFLEMDLPDISLHASTQAACDSAEKLAFLASVGFNRAILARELSLGQIKSISETVDIELEAFVYGALCVSESGRCYLSQAICGRSGNRGECAQPCRRDWSLVDDNGKILIKDRPLLSIKDLDLSDELGALIGAGVHNFKIEGRLKDADYVKNVVSYMRRKLDALLEGRPDLSRASSGRAAHGFLPDPKKTFQRGHTQYQLSGKRQPISTGSASGHLGEPVGTVISMDGAALELDRDHGLRPGDGIAAPGPGGRIVGTVVNAVEGKCATVQSPVGFGVGSVVCRNYDHAWHRALRSAKVERRISVNAHLDFPQGRARLRLADEDGCAAEAQTDDACQVPKKPEAFVETAKGAIAKMGDSPFTLGECQVDPVGFLPLSRLNALRRRAVDILMQERLLSHPRQGRRAAESAPKALPAQNLGYEWNVANSLARAFYLRHGATHIEQAYEISPSQGDPPLMATRLCLKHELGWCRAHKNEAIAKPSVLQDNGVVGLRPNKAGHEAGADCEMAGADNKTSLENIAPSDANLYLKNGPVTLKCHFDCGRCRMLLLGR